MNHSDLSPYDGGSRCGLFVFHISRTYRYPLPALCLVEDISIFLILVFLHNIESIYRSSTDLIAEFDNKHRHDVMRDDGRRPQYLH